MHAWTIEGGPMMGAWGDEGERAARQLQSDMRRLYKRHRRRRRLLDVIQLFIH
jgi:hypothetical protein